MIWAKIRVSSRMAWKTICSAIWPSKSPQAQVWAKDRGFTCLILDYDDMKGTEDDSLRLF